MKQGCGRAGLAVLVLFSLMLAGAGLSAPAALASAQAGPAPVSGVQAWGDNSAGELGDGTLSQAHVPAGVSGLGGVTAMAAGARFNLALRSDGTVVAWGAGGFGQLGDGRTADSAIPVPVRGLTGVKAVAAGGGHALALLSDGTVMAWGDNEFGQLGDGRTAGSAVPVPVQGLTGVRAIAAGELHSLAVLADGTVMAWGDNGNGQLGDGTFKNSAVPVPVGGLTGARTVSAGGLFSLALLGNGTVRAWGSNIIGQLGNGSRRLSSDVPVAVSHLRGVTQISAGFFHALALRGSGRAAGWGDNSFGQLGNTGVDGSSHVPVPVMGISGARAVSAGGMFSLALVSGGTVMAFGDNAQGQLGDGTTADSTAPVPVTGLAGMTLIAAGASHGLAAPAGTAAVRATAAAGSPSIWRAVRTPNPGAPPPPGLSDIGFTGVSAATAGDAWAVGTNGLHSTPSRAFAEHWTGTRWTAVTVPGPAGRQTALQGVLDLGPGNAWAAGRSFGTSGSEPSRTLIEHWNGQAWAIVASPDPAGGKSGFDELDAVAGTGPADLWAAGDDFFNGPGEIHMLFEHFNGTTWTATTTHIPGIAKSVAAISPDDVWAVGTNPDGTRCGAGVPVCNNTVAAHFNGRTWTMVPTPDLVTGNNAQNFLTGVSQAGPGNVWASGYEQFDGPVGNRYVPYLLHFSHGAVTLVRVPDTGTEGSQLRAITAASASDVWAVGETDDTDGALRTITEHYNGSHWSITPSVDPGEAGPLAENSLDAASSPGGGTVWALGTQDILGHCCQQTLALHTTAG